MSNKSQLQTNNADLQSILSTVLGLPTQESCKNGAYVWKKYNKIPGGTIEITQLTGAENPTVLQLSSSDIDLSSIDGNFFTGITTTLTEIIDHEVIFTSATTLTIDGTQYTYSYNASTAQIIINSTGYADHYWYSISIEEVKTFISYVVSDSESAYPDGGTQDGYWYEKSGGTYTIYTGDITPTSNMPTVTIDNPFGKTEKVKVASIMWKSGRNNHDLGVYYLEGNIDEDTVILWTGSGPFSYPTTPKPTITDTKITMSSKYNSNYVYWKSGVTYTWRIVGIE